MQSYMDLSPFTVLTHFFCSQIDAGALSQCLNYRCLFPSELAIFGKTPMKLPLAKRSFDLDLDIWLGNRKEPNSQMHVQWFH